MDSPATNPAPGISPGTAPGTTPAPRGKWVGRAALCCLTLFLILATLAALTSLLWLATPLQSNRWFLLLHRALLAGVFLDGLALFVILFILQRLLVPPRDFHYSDTRAARVHVGLTAYNDEACIAQAVRDFKSCPAVHKVVVVENKSKDRTFQTAQAAGADAVVTETIPGYGSCCMRALAEAAAGLSDSDVVVLCEGDMTFSALDIPKFLAYLDNADLVLGTRATQELRASNTQMDYLLNPGNQVVAKLIQTRFWGTRLTDCGCTYRAMRIGSYRRLRDHLHVTASHFSPHMYIQALKLGMRVVEIPVTFRCRVGQSKGVGSNKIKAAQVALRMLALLYTA